jgi:hypothetical protein
MAEVPARPPLMQSTTTALNEANHAATVLENIKSCLLGAPQTTTGQTEPPEPGSVREAIERTIERLRYVNESLAELDSEIREQVAQIWGTGFQDGFRRVNINRDALD